MRLPLLRDGRPRSAVALRLIALLSIAVAGAPIAFGETSPARAQTAPAQPSGPAAPEVRSIAPTAPAPPGGPSGAPATPSAPAALEDLRRRGAPSATPSSEPPAAPRSALPATRSDGPLRIGLATIAPPAVCAPSFQVVEIRNSGDQALGDIRFSAAPPLGPKLFAFASDRVEISTDDGRTWAPIGPPTGVGSRAAPYLWTSDQAPVLARLGPAGRPDDSVLVRWRAALGEGFADAPADRRRLWISATAVDAARRPVRTAERAVLLPVRRPSLALSLVGRNATRGGGFSAAAPAAPGDVVEWRLSVENRGDAPAPETRLRLGAPGRGGGALSDLARSGGAAAQAAGPGVFSLGPLGAGGRKTILFRETVGAVCGARPTRVTGSWGCAAPERSDGLAAIDSGLAEALLRTAPVADDARIAVRIAGIGGRTRPGNRAEVVVTIENQGPPMLSPAALIALPDGYVFDDTAPVRVFGASARIRRAAVDPAKPAAPNFDLQDAEGRPAALGPGERVEIRFAARRDRPMVFEEDEAQASLRFANGCGAVSTTPVSSTPVRPRTPKLAVRVEPVASPIVGAAGQRKTFRATVENTGDDALRQVRLALDLGAGWVAEPPERCAPRRAGDGDPKALRVLCALGADLRPGRVATFDFDLTVADAALEGAPLSIRAVADGAGRRADGALSGAVLVRAETRASAVGFELRQTLLTRDGRPRDPASPLSLGERISIALDARWFGGDGRVDAISIAQTIPETLAVRDARADGRGVGLDSVLTPTGAGGRGRLLWSLADFEGAGQFKGRVDLEVVEPDRVDPADAAPAPSRAQLQTVSVGADAVFSVGGRAFGVDAQNAPEDGAVTGAAPIALRIRRPDIRLRLEIDDRRRIPNAAPSATGAPAPGYSVVGGESLTASVTLSNAGAAPGFFDWVELRAPIFVRVAPFADDKLDNDGDGLIDETDEASVAVFERGARDGAESGPGAPPRGDRLRWISLGAPGGGPVAAGGLRIAPGETVRWRIRLDVAGWAEPGRAGRVALDGQFGAAPFGQEGGETRTRVSARDAIATPPVQGFLVLSRTGIGGDLDARLAHGEDVEHRLSVRLPPGQIRGGAVEVLLPPGFSDIRPRARLGPGLSCPDIQQPAVERLRPPDQTPTTNAGAEADPDQPPRAERDAPPPRNRLLWRLGRCEVALDAVEGGRIALLDFTARAVDADPSADPEARRAWRRPTIAARFRHRADAGRQLVPLGRSALEIAGPALRIDLQRRDPKGAAAAPDPDAAVDAGDPLAVSLTLRNVGDAPIKGLRLEIPDGRGDPAQGPDPSKDAPAPASLSGVDCPSVAWRGAAALGARAQTAPGAGEDAAAPSCGPRLVAPNLTLKPGDQATIALSLRATRAARIGGALSAPIRVVARASAADPAAPPIRVSRVAIAAPIAPPPPPDLESVSERTALAAARSAEGTPPAAIGDRFRIRARFPVPEGRADDAALLLNLRLIGRGGVADASAALALSGATLTRERADLIASANPGGVNTARPGAPVDLDGVLETTADPDALGGWKRFRVPLGALRVEQPTEAAGTQGYRLEATVIVQDATSARQGRRIEAQPEFRIAAPPGARAPKPAAPNPASSGDAREAALGPPTLRPRTNADASLGPVRTGATETEPTEPEPTATEATATEPTTTDPTARAAILTAAAQPRALARIAEPFVELVALVEAGDGAVPQGGGARIVARACNRGEATAYGVRLEGALPPELSPTGRALLRIRSEATPRRRGAPPAAYRRYGRVRFGRGGAVFAEPTDPLAPVAPGDCVELSLPTTLWSTPVAPELRALFRVSGYQGRASATRPGRRYEGARAVAARIAVARLSVTGPGSADLGARGRSVYPIAVEIPQAAGAGTAGAANQRVSVSISGGGDLTWRLFRDANGDGALDDADPPWRDGATPASGGRLELLAVFEAARELETGWRGAAVVNAIAIGPNGGRLRGVHSLTITRDGQRAGELRTARTMALDRDCDGRLDDERGGAAGFAPSLDAAPGECVVMRLGFVNVGAASVEGVAIADDLFPGARFAEGSARVVRAPRGLIAKPFAPPNASDRRIVFRFVGALAPKLQGVVEYRIRLADR